MKIQNIIFGLIFTFSIFSCSKEITETQLEGTWIVNSYNEAPLPISYCFIQFYKGKYNIFWWSVDRFYYYPSRDGSYNHFDDILFFKEAYVSYSIDYNEPDIYFEMLSKDTLSTVRFKVLRARKYKDIPVFNRDSLTVDIEGILYPVDTADTDLFNGK
ncbi:MAG: hypothetical protein N2662_09015 [Bacteroidales bacterium]|nr:hypothetical protein [Bacteroidales bacterium]